MPVRKWSRRDFLRAMALALGGLTVGESTRRGFQGIAPIAQGDFTPTARAYLPLVMRSEPTPTPTPSASRVVHVHAPSATNWTSGYYYNAVDQSVVNEMVDRGVMALTGASTRADAWRALIPNYSGGVVAIKVNFNNSGNDNIIDALIHPVNAVIQGLLEIGVAAQKILVYDAIRPIPTYFRNGCSYSGVQFYDTSNASFPLQVSFSRPGIPAEYLASAVVDAAYLINMPILKRHSITGVTLGFKNHFGTINNPYGLHNYVDVDGAQYSRTYNPMVDIYLNPHIRTKTVLVLGDGLFGSKDDTNTKPTVWQTFSNKFPNSLFFSRDPVAVDCVMYDLLNAEPWYNPDEAADYLRLAAVAGLGVYEQGDPWQTPYGSGYSLIDYVKIPLT